MIYARSTTFSIKFILGKIKFPVFSLIFFTDFQIPCVFLILNKFSNSLTFPCREFFLAIFPVSLFFPVRGHPGYRSIPEPYITFCDHSSVRESLAHLTHLSRVDLPKELNDHSERDEAHGHSAIAHPILSDQSGNT